MYVDILCLPKSALHYSTVPYTKVYVFTSKRICTLLGMVRNFNQLYLCIVKIQNTNDMKHLFIALMAAACILPTHAQKEQQLQEVTVVASRTTNNAEGYTTNLRGTDIAKGKRSEEHTSELQSQR